MSRRPARRARRFPVVPVVGAVALAAICWFTVRAVATRTPGPPRAALSLATTLGGVDTAGFERALRPRAFDFPVDHGEHPGFRNEWWYVTGNLDTDEGRRFAFQLTLFRTALTPSMPDRRSEWATRQAWMAHFAVTDAGGTGFHAFQRFERGAYDLAGATARPFRVWLRNWSVESAGSGFFPLRVRAAEGDIAIDIRLDRGKPLVFNGDSGLSRKGAALGNASFYYSFTRLPASGAIDIGDHSWAVAGNAWIDREWSTSSLPPGIAGWDWFAVQLDDSTEIMAYRLRHDDGSTDRFSAGTFVDTDGVATTLDARDFDIRNTAAWTSPVDGARYPARWTMLVPGLDLALDISTIVADQELDLAFRYWEGAVVATGTRSGRPVHGNGYVELTGYSGHSADTGAQR